LAIHSITLRFWLGDLYLLRLRPGCRDRSNPHHLHSCKELDCGVRFGSNGVPSPAHRPDPSIERTPCPPLRVGQAADVAIEKVGNS
jgi:hypothetical protein